LSVALPSASLGLPVNFPTDAFNTAIRFAMQMGAPVDPDKRPKFVFPSTGKTYWKDGVLVVNARTDRDGKPLNPEIEIRVAKPVTKQVDCAIVVERVGAGGEVAVGNFNSTRLVVTLLEEEWAEVVGCESVEYNGDLYVYAYEPENYGLFDAGVHTFIFNSKDET